MFFFFFFGGVSWFWVSGDLASSGSEFIGEGRGKAVSGFESFGGLGFWFHGDGCLLLSLCARVTLFVGYFLCFYYYYFFNFKEKPTGDLFDEFYTLYPQNLNFKHLFLKLTSSNKIMSNNFLLCNIIF